MCSQYTQYGFMITCSQPSLRTQSLYDLCILRHPTVCSIFISMLAQLPSSIVASIMFKYLSNITWELFTCLNLSTLLFHLHVNHKVLSNLISSLLNIVYMYRLVVIENSSNIRMSKIWFWCCNANANTEWIWRRNSMWLWYFRNYEEIQYQDFNGPGDLDRGLSNSKFYHFHLPNLRAFWIYLNNSR